MKTSIIKAITIAMIVLPSIVFGQQVNWKNFDNKRNHLLNIHAGWDYGMIAGIGYGQKLKVKMPIVINANISSPFGKQVNDDFKTRLGAQVQLYSIRNYSISVKAYSVFRRYENELVRLVNFGSEFSTDFGYYKPRWYVAGEFGFDKAITTHIKNSDEMKSIYPGIKNGWYIPTGGNFFYGVSGGYSFRQYDIYLKCGKITTQSFENDSALPIYAQLGFNTRI